ncbi:PREDICTED: uncharacterized protein LOC108803451, partial [Nanorana parkeri]|uniref:uncharacterized protein LOC108803451 n=1 Tax=Nanorana parkeri TaxID=125878 RepID=UPI0008547D6A
MASGNLKEKLECSLCLNIYTDPVNLKCGHNYCRVCIGHWLDTQEESGGYSCPQCREKFRKRPALQKNFTLCEILQTTKSDLGKTGIFCTQCYHAPVPAVKSCLLCEASLCDNHLRVHSQSPEHVLCDPTTSLENRKCSVHKKILEYYCTEDSACICVSCRLDGEHRGHQVETLDEASEKKKKKLRNVLQKLMTEREEMERRVQSLEEHRRRVQGEAAGETERVTALLRDLRRRLEDLEKRVLSDISGQAERTSLYVTDMIRELEIKKDELSRKMRHIEELCNLTDPLTVLQESDTGDLCDTEDGDDEDRERHDRLLHDGGGLDVAGISHTLHTGISDIMSGVNQTSGVSGVTDILLDVNTAANNLLISHDRKSASWSDINQNRPETPERFQYYQVLSSRSFSSGRHYWEVDVRGSEWWKVGMCYPSIDRRGRHTVIGHNKKSWSLERSSNKYSAIYNNNQIPLSGDVSSNRVRIDLDYEAGRISFYDLCDPIRHLHTFTTTFTEPLHAGLWTRHLNPTWPLTLRKLHLPLLHRLSIFALRIWRIGAATTIYGLGGLPEATGDSDLHATATRVHFFSLKTEILSKAQSQGTLDFDGATISLFPDLSKRRAPRPLSKALQGLNQPNKRVKAFRQFKSLHADVICLQETHFKQGSSPSYEVSADTKTRGVLIAFRRSLPFVRKDSIKDPEGRYLILMRLMDLHGPFGTRYSLIPKCLLTLAEFFHMNTSSQTSGVSGFTDILLDVSTAANNLHISHDRKSASWSPYRNRPETPERFQDSQVLSSQSFSSGRHYWEVDVGWSGWWRVGMCYPSIERRGGRSGIGDNKKSWSLVRWGRCNQYSARHDRKKIRLPGKVSSNRVRIDLDYEAGRISFYDLCDPIRLLHTFTTTFTEPLHAGLWVGDDGCIKISGGNQSADSLLDGRGGILPSVVSTAHRAASVAGLCGSELRAIRLLLGPWMLEAVEVADFILRERDIQREDIKFYADSKVPLGDIYNQTKRFYVYVSHRIERI